MFNVLMRAIVILLGFLLFAVLFAGARVLGSRRRAKPFNYIDRLLVIDALIVAFFLVAMLLHPVGTTPQFFIFFAGVVGAMLTELLIIQIYCKRQLHKSFLSSVMQQLVIAAIVAIALVIALLWQINSTD